LKWPNGQAQSPIWTTPGTPISTRALAAMPTSVLASDGTMVRFPGLFFACGRHSSAPRVDQSSVFQLVARSLFAPELCVLQPASTHDEYLNGPPQGGGARFSSCVYLSKSRFYLLQIESINIIQIINYLAWLNFNQYQSVFFLTNQA
jgi:hypothetical protein